MSFGSFCVKKDDDQKDLQVLQPEFISIEGNQIGFLSYFNIVQSVENKTGEDLEEITYIFPTDNRLCLYGLTFYIGKEKIEAKIEKKTDSKEIFEEAKATGKTAVMSENISPGLTLIHVGNVPKNETIKVVLNCSFMSQLSSSNKILTKIPLYGCDLRGDFLDLTDYPSLNLSAKIDVIQFSEIKNVNVNFDDYSFDKNRNKIEIKNAVVSNDNFIIEIELSEKVQSQMIKSGKMTALSLIPEFDSNQKSSENKEFVFLIDCSASMLGESIAKAKESINLFISKIPENSKFNIIQFGTSYRKMFNEFMVANQRNKKEANEKVSKIKANLGGTEMLQLFEDLFENPSLCQREIFLITDGEVYKREEVVKLIDANKDFNRIFAIGLGNGADAGFLDEIAEMTNGKSDFVYDSKELTNKISEHLELSLIPSATNTELHIEGEKEIQVSPFPLPPLLPGVVHHIFIKSSENSKEEKNSNVLITSKFSDDDDEIEFVINDECMKNLQIDKNEKNPILSLFAHKQMKKLEKNNEEMATKLSLESGVLCKYTSYIGVSSLSYVEMDRCKHVAGTLSSIPDSYDECSILERSKSSRDELNHIISTRRKIASKCRSLVMTECEEKPTFMSKVKNFFGYFKFWGNKKDDNDETPKVCFTCDEKSCEETPEVCFTCDEKSCEETPEVCYTCDEKSCEETPEVCFTCESEQPQLNDYSLNKDDLKLDPYHTWKNNASVIEIVKMQSRDGFWDISTKFLIKHFANESDIPSIGTSFGNAIIDKRVRSTVFVLAFLMKFHIENYGGNSQVKALKWLNKISKTVNWKEIISDFKDNLQNQNIDLESET